MAVAETDSIWKLERRISEQLLGWSVFSVAVGLLLRRPGASHGARAFGLQTLAWGTMDGVIALIGRAVSTRKARRPDAFSRATQRRERDGLRRLLLVNVGLDGLYVLGGVALMRGKGARPGRFGHGLGVLIQGLFLLAFDGSHALRLKGSLVGESERHLPRLKGR